MSSTASIPDGSQLKSFWSRPEGKTGLVVLAAAAGAGLWLWGKILPWLIQVASNTLELAVLVIGIVLFYAVFCRNNFLVFRLIMRWITSLVVEVDPIGILEEHLSKMRKRREEMGRQIANVSGQIRMLKDVIQKNKETASQNLGMAAEAKKRAAAAADQNVLLRMTLQEKAKARAAGRLERSNISYQQLLAKLQTIYDLLTKWAEHVDYFIEDTADEVKQAKTTHTVINAAYRAYRTALSVIKGNANEDDLYNTTMEHLAEEASVKLGEMEDFQRVAQDFMDTIDIQNGAVENQALAELDKYEQKLLTEGSADTSFLLPTVSVDKQKVPVARKTGTAGDEYSSLFDSKKK